MKKNILCYLGYITTEIIATVYGISQIEHILSEDMCPKYPPWIRSSLSYASGKTTSKKIYPPLVRGLFYTNLTNQCHHWDLEHTLTDSSHTYKWQL